ncbi:MAG: hypothetical protein LBS01_07070 [Prevotellaceae bacterium]|nr:hypothetical protein [Prevotellaceae bacterium]
MENNDAVGKKIAEAKETIKITYDGLRMMMIMNYSSVSYNGGLYGKEVFFSEGFSGDVSYLFQALGNIGATARDTDLDVDISYIVISNKLLEDFRKKDLQTDFFTDLSQRLNTASSSYRRMKFLSENHLFLHLVNHGNRNNDPELKLLLNKYKESRKDPAQRDLFATTQK